MLVIDGFDWSSDLPELAALDLKTGKTSKIADLDPSLSVIFGAARVQH